MQFIERMKNFIQRIRTHALIVYIRNHRALFLGDALVFAVVGYFWARSGFGINAWYAGVAGIVVVTVLVLYRGTHISVAGVMPTPQSVPHSSPVTSSPSIPSVPTSIPGMSPIVTMPAQHGRSFIVKAALVILAGVVVGAGAGVVQLWLAK